MSFRTSRRVEFRDTDAAGIVHFSAFFTMMEAAEHELLRSLGIAVLPDRDVSERLSWPRVSAQCDYLAAAHFEDELSIEVGISKIGNSSVSYEVLFQRGETNIAKGKLVAVCCRLLDGGGLEKATIPQWMREKFAELA